jgi:hypothetical protein
VCGCHWRRESFGVDAKEPQAHERIADDVVDCSHRGSENPQLRGLDAALTKLFLERFAIVPLRHNCTAAHNHFSVTGFRRKTFFSIETTAYCANCETFWQHICDTAVVAEDAPSVLGAASGTTARR